MVLVLVLRLVLRLVVVMMAGVMRGDGEGEGEGELLYVVVGRNCWVLWLNVRSLFILGGSSLLNW